MAEEAIISKRYLSSGGGDRIITSHSLHTVKISVE